MEIRLANFTIAWSTTRQQPCRIETTFKLLLIQCPTGLKPEIKTQLQDKE
jgi:hypothetical protein